MVKKLSELANDPLKKEDGRKKAFIATKIVAYKNIVLSLTTTIRTMEQLINKIGRESTAQYPEFKQFFDDAAATGSAECKAVIDGLSELRNGYMMLIKRLEQEL